MNSEYRIGLTQAKDKAKALAKQLKGGEVLALIGPLGSGKTTFTQALGQALKIRHKILSPTFVLMQEYPGRLLVGKKSRVTLLHLDLYRTGTLRDIVSLGLMQAWQRPDTVCIIEWADKIKKHLPPGTIYIYLTRDVSTP
jgi:tRNA threonylcarbamoyladenosine biosynthesis protein TsaE